MGVKKGGAGTPLIWRRIADNPSFSDPCTHDG
jgi:hypothetical protein